MPNPVPKSLQTLTPTADPFVVFAENQLALTAGLRVSSVAKIIMRGTQWTCIYGPKAVGKTHLLRHVLRETLRRKPRLKYISTSAQILAEHVSDPVRRLALLEVVRDCDMILCDDLDDLAANSDLQRQWYGSVESMADVAPQLVVTLSRPPGEIEGLSARIVNRCHGGLAVGQRYPGQMSRQKLLEHFAQIQQIPLPPDVVKSIAEQTSGSPGGLRKVLSRLEELSRREGRFIDLELVTRAKLQGDRPGGLSLDELAEAVATEFGTTVEALKSRSRHQSLVVPRQCAMLLARELTPLPLERVGEFFGNRNHTTVSHGLVRLEALLAESTTLRQQMQRIRSRLPEYERAPGKRS